MKLSTIAFAAATITGVVAHPFKCAFQSPVVCQPPNMLALGSKSHVDNLECLLIVAECRYMVGGQKGFHRADDLSKEFSDMYGIVRDVCGSDDYCWKYYYQYCPKFDEYYGAGYPY